MTRVHSLSGAAVYHSLSRHPREALFSRPSKTPARRKVEDQHSIRVARLLPPLSFSLLHSPHSPHSSPPSHPPSHPPLIFIISHHHANITSRHPHSLTQLHTIPLSPLLTIASPHHPHPPPTHTSTISSITRRSSARDNLR